MNAFKRSNTRLGKTKYAGKKKDLYDEEDSYVDNDQRPTSQLSPSGGTTYELGSSELSIKTSNSPLRLFGHGKNSDSTKVIKSIDHVPNKTLADELSNLTPAKNASKRFNTEISTSISKLLELQSSTRTLSDSCKLKASRNKNLNRNWPSGADTNGPYYHSSSSRSNSEDSTTSGPLKPHTGGDGRWEAIQLANSRESPLGLSHFRLLKRLGNGDIGSVYLVELRGTSTFFAMKVMDKASLMSRNKLPRAETEREILGLLDHPFLPTLYSHFETEKFYCLVMEYCSGGNLHSLRQRQPNKYFTEQAARFYASEVLLALEYLHMLGIIYRDLKPENVLVRDGGHIMLSDFDLSLRCSVNPTLVKSSSVQVGGLERRRHSSILDTPSPPTNINQTPSSSSSSASFLPRILPKKKNKTRSSAFGSIDGSNIELVAEPSSARSMSFVGTHEYLAPEIICGEGHGSAVDWWTFGIFLYELLHGSTPFRGPGNRATLFNAVGQPLRFPEAPSVSPGARDLIRGLLVKDPQRRIASKRGATEIKQHPFFDGVNWALVRSAMPPCVPATVDFSVYASKDEARVGKKGLDNGGGGGGGGGKKTSNDSSYLHFEYF